MKSRFCRIAKCCLFCAVLFSSLWSINYLLLPKYIYQNSKWPTTSTYRQFYRMKKNTVDVLFLGSSVCVNAIAPQEIYDTYGIRSYNLGSEQQSIFLSYFWLKEALRFQSPKVVVLDTRFLYNLHPENPIVTGEGLTRKSLDPMHLSPVKIEAIDALCKIDPSQSRLSYYLTNIRFHTRWKEAGEYDLDLSLSQMAELKGFSAIDEPAPESFETFDPVDSAAWADPQPVMLEYLDRITELCNARNIRLILISLPGNNMNDGVNNMLTDYARQNDLCYYNFCETAAYNAIGAQLPREKTMKHANLWGAVKMSDRLGELLRDEHGVQGTTDEQWESTKPYYAQLKKSWGFREIADLENYLGYYLDLMQGGYDFSMFLSVRSDAADGLSEAAAAKMQACGLQTDLRDHHKTSYCAIVNADGGVEERLDDRAAVTLFGSSANGRFKYAVTSDGIGNKGNSSIRINDMEYSKNHQGLNIVIYDNVQGMVVDAVCFDTHTDGAASR